MDRERLERLEKIEGLYLDLTGRMRAVQSELDQAKDKDAAIDACRSMLRVFLRHVEEQEEGGQS